MLSGLLPVWAAITATLAVLMAFARTPPEEAALNLSKWLGTARFHQMQRWLQERAIAQWVRRYGRYVMAILLFGGGMLFHSWLFQTRPLPITRDQPAESPKQIQDTTVQLQKLQYEKHITMGRTTFFNIMNNLSVIPTELKAGPKHFVIVTSSPENAQLREDTNAVFYLTWAISHGPLTALNLPNYEHDRDAPEFEGEEHPGVTIHSENTQVADFIERPLANCFKVSRTSRMPGGLSEYYRRTFPQTISDNDDFTWLEIGKGQPWKALPCVGAGN
jgi:hypothetical protein